MSTSPPPPPASSSRLFAVAAVILVLIGAAVYFLAPPAKTPPNAPPTAPYVPPTVPSPVVTPAPEASPLATPEAPKPSAPAGKPAPAPKPAARVEKLLREADAARVAAKDDVAARLYDQILKIDSKNREALAGKIALISLKRTFTAERTLAENMKGVSKNVGGFAGGSAVTVKRAPVISGRIEFTVEPHRLKPGDKYSIRVSLVNEGKDTIKITNLEVATSVNGKRSAAPVEPKVKEVASHQNEVILEAGGVWKDDVASWLMEVAVTSKKDDVYRNALTWK